jgi:hypothetical protein
MQQAFIKQTRERGIRRWRTSARFNRMERIDDSLPSRRHLKLVTGIPRAQSTTVFWLRIGYAPLHQYLHKIHAREDGPACTACGGDYEAEPVRHLLLDCPAHEPHRRRLRATLGHRKAEDLRFLLSDRRGHEALMKYLDATRRFVDTLGTLSGPRE